MKPSPLIRIAIVEDDTRLLRSLSETLATQQDLRVVATHADGESALAADWSGIDLLLVDLELPGITGHQLVAKALESKPDLVAVVLSIHDSRDCLFAALRAGASGYILKGGTSGALIEGIRAAAKGESPISPAMARHLVSEFGTWRPAEADATLSPREVRLLSLLGEGLSYKEVAAQLGLSPHTVHTHVKNIYGKMRARNRAQAIQRAKARGLLGN